LIAQNPLLRTINNTNSGTCEIQLLRTGVYTQNPRPEVNECNRDFATTISYGCRNPRLFIDLPLFTTVRFATSDRPNHLALPHRGEARRRHGRCVQGRGRPPGPLCRPEVPA